MKHATANTLATLRPLLDRLRALAPLVERTPGAFYLKSAAFLHFHDDPSGLYADVKLDPGSFTRWRVTTQKEQAAFLARVRRRLAATPTPAAPPKPALPLNRAWHAVNRMPPRATAGQRIQWHLAHARQCGCRPVPAGVLALIEARGLEVGGVEGAEYARRRSRPSLGGSRR